MYDVIAKKVAIELSRRFDNLADIINFSVPTFEYNNFGVAGSAKDARIYYDDQEVYVRKLIEYLSKRYKCNEEAIEKIKNAFIVGREHEV